MNKPRKPTGEITRSDPVIYSSKLEQPEIKHEMVSKIPEIRYITGQVWKTFEIDKHPDTENGAWLSMIYDLLHNLDDLARLFRFELQHRSWLNAYLLATGISQVVEDYLHNKLPLFGKTVRYLQALPAPVGPILASFAKTANKYFLSINEKKRAIRKLVDWQQKLAKLINELAEVVINYAEPEERKATGLVADGGTLMAYIPYFPVQLRQEIVRLPSCFRSYDQQPEDLHRIVNEFAIHWPERDQHLAVVGLRTSGSYLAPLYAAILKSHGYQNIDVLTLRPGSMLSTGEQAILRQLAAENGLAILCADPPITGDTVIETAAILENAGISPRSIIQFLQLFGNYDDLPDSLQKYPSVMLSWINWSVHRQLELPRVKKVLSSACMPPYKLAEIMRLPYFDGLDRREHVCALFRVKLQVPHTNEVITRMVQVKGVGLGYFGEHSVSVIQRLQEYSAPVITLQDGLLYQEITTPTEPLETSTLLKEENVVDQMVRYILERNHQLPAAADISLQLSGRNAVWEVASNLLSKAFGSAWFLARLPIIDPYVKDALKTPQPSVIDGDMALYHWYLQQQANKPLVKMYSAERDFTHRDLCTYDPVYDLANLALEVDADIQPNIVRHTYEAMSGDVVSPERWTLYQLVHLWNLFHLNPDSENQISRHMSQVIQRYFSEIYFEDLQDAPQGPVCVLDIDSVLETKPLGFLSLSPESARSLRALALHGYRVILATGRSLEEVKERCDEYHLAGGVAEFGAVLYDHNTGQVQPLLTQEEQDTLYRVRSKLTNKPALYLDNDYRFAVRAYRLDDNGFRERLSAEVIEQVLTETETADEVYAIQGECQTDFMVRRIDKGMGVREWLDWFDKVRNYTNHSQTVEKPFALAVGDSTSDLPIFPLAEIAYATQNANQGIKESGIPLTNRPFQRGLEEAVGKLIGHQPGSCKECQLHPFTTHTSFMQDLLSVQADEPLDTFWRAMRLWMKNGGWLHVGR